MSKLTAELKRRAEQKVFKLEEYCFDKQLAFIRDPARFKVAVCSRRAGKTEACAADLLETAATQQGDVAYITLSRVTAKRIIWKNLLRLNKEFNIGGTPDNADLSLLLPNGNTIYISGAKDASEADKFRGLALRKVYIDECQSFRAYIKDLIEDVIEPALTDYNGSLCLIGTPGPVPAGFFYDSATSGGYSAHHWTMQDNPHIERKSGKSPIDTIQDLAKRRGITIQDPSIQREYFGKWEKDDDALVYKFDNMRNTYLPPAPTKMTHIFGIDIGYRDADAIAVLGYHDESKEVYLVEELITTKQDITALAEQIKVLQAKYDPVRMVMDAGALGKKIQEEIRVRHSLAIEAADKNRKHEYIKLLNDDLKTAKFKALPASRFAEDSMLVTWNYDDPQKPQISDKYHTDVGDAVLYAWRECRHYMGERPAEKPKRDSEAWMRAQEEAEAEAMEASKRDNNIGPSVEDMAFLLADDFE